MKRHTFDVELFLELNEEYADRPLVPKPRSNKPRAVQSRGDRVADELDRRFSIRKKRALELGCGRGEVARSLARKYGCAVVGLDIVEYPQWETESQPGASVMKLDVTREDYSQLGQFDFIYSLAVFEHIVHPFRALTAVRDLLHPDGQAYIVANLYRGPKASHRYREVFFPWPHLLFPDSVFLEFYERKGMRPVRPSWVNKLTVAEYHAYFEVLGLKVKQEWFATTPIDEPFYRRFEDVLSRYPRFDLERDFIHVVLAHKDPVEDWMRKALHWSRKLTSAEASMRKVLRRLPFGLGRRF